MTFTDKQKAALEAPLSTATVKRNPKGHDYIEGWHAIAEANRIFGFDGWSRELTALEIVGAPYEVNGNWRVGYRATVRVTVWGEEGRSIIRDGTGYGSGIVRDLNDAHEGAVKEAETDAMKRALMTFGNPFGLALYDKERANVADPAKALIDDGQWAELSGLIDATGTSSVKICDGYGIASLREMTVPQYQKARAALLKRLPQPEEKAA